MSDLPKEPMEMDDDASVEVEVVTFEDEEGNDISLEIIEEFEHNGANYAIMSEFIEDDHECGDECDCEQSVFIMEVVNKGEEAEEFVPVEDELLEELTTIAAKLLDVELIEEE